MRTTRGMDRSLGTRLPYALVAAALGCGGPAEPAATAPSIASTSVPSASPPVPVPPLTRAGAAASLAPLSVAPSAHNLIKNSTFDRGRSLPWLVSFTSPAHGEAKVEDGALCLEIGDAGAHPWDAQFRHREMTIESGHQYHVRFKIASTRPTSLLTKIGMSGPPYKAYWQQQIELVGGARIFSGDFVMSGPDDATAEFAFHAGGKGASKDVPFDVCVDDVVLEDLAFTPKPEPKEAPIPGVLVDQVGYLPLLAKLAIVKSDATTPLSWEVLDKAGTTVLRGQTVVHGADRSSGDSVHLADFSALTSNGEGYAVRVGSETSHPFAIGPSVYHQLKYDALHYFYHTRSGIALTMPYAGDPKWTRPAGHPGDKSVPCAPDAHCDYTLDVSGGWYDAGDHGKYVVNGGIAVWTLLDLYERTKYLGSSLADFADGKMAIPENHNGVSDLLDEARWELEFLLKMQVPQGQRLAGMAHHKIHDREWTALGTRPDEDSVPRWLRPVSTAATLNLAAAGAQCARVYKTIDAAWSNKCLQAAERAWAAAVANPSLLITAADTVGGGPYDDDDVSDEFYWAASELYVTTKKEVYETFLLQSPHRTNVPAAPKGGDVTPMTWRNVAALGTISLAVVPGVPAEIVTAARAAIAKAADAYVEMDRAEGYRVGFRPDESGKYPWGSNGCVLDNALVMGLAYDFGRDGKYLDAMEDSLSYVLGRNPMDQSYVTGYGFRPLQNPHHRFWAHQANAAFPSAPPGVLSGGPNSGLQDPYVQAAGLAGCAPMKCFADNIEAWSANEEAINWNAPLAWVAAFLDEHARARGAASASPGGKR